MWARACAWYECAHVALMARCHTSVCSTAAHSTAHRDVDAVDVECFDLRGALEEGDGPSGEGGRGLGGWGRVSVLREHSGGRRRRHGRGAARPSGRARPPGRVARVPRGPTGPRGPRARHTGRPRAPRGARAPRARARRGVPRPPAQLLAAGQLLGLPWGAAGAMDASRDPSGETSMACTAHLVLCVGRHHRCACGLFLHLMPIGLAASKAPGATRPRRRHCLLALCPQRSQTVGRPFRRHRKRACAFDPRAAGPIIASGRCPQPGFADAV